MAKQTIKACVICGAWIPDGPARWCEPCRAKPELGYSGAGAPKFISFEIAEFIDAEGREHIRPRSRTMLIQWQAASGMNFWPTITPPNWTIR